MRGFAIIHDPPPARPRRDRPAGALLGAPGRLGLLLPARRSGCTRSIHNALLALVVDSLATLFPATPGGAGTKQGLIVFLFRGEAISKSLLLAFSVGMNIAARRLQPAARAGRDVHDGAHDLVAAAARRREAQEQRQPARRPDGRRLYPAPGAVRLDLPARDGARRRAAVHLRGRGGRRARARS